MKISTKGRYALRLMMEFARQPEQVTRLKDAAAKQELSEKYLEQIVSVLSKAGFVKSIRGAQSATSYAGPRAIWHRSFVSGRTRFPAISPNDVYPAPSFRALRMRSMR